MVGIIGHGDLKRSLYILNTTATSTSSMTHDDIVSIAESTGLIPREIQRKMAFIANNRTTTIDDEPYPNIIINFAKRIPEPTKPKPDHSFKAQQKRLPKFCKR
jgi:hypothetical protein